MIDRLEQSQLAIELRLARLSAQYRAACLARRLRWLALALIAFAPIATVCAACGCTWPIALLGTLGFLLIGPSVSIDWESDPQKVLDAMRAQQVELAKLKGAFQDFAKKSADGAKEHLSVLGQINESLEGLGAKAIAGFAGISSAGKVAEKIWEGMNEDIERTVELSHQAVEAFQGVAAGAARLNVKTPLLGPEDREKFEAAKAKLAGQVDGSGDLLGAAIEERGNLPIENVVGSARVAGQVLPGEQNVAEASGLAADITRMQRVAGVRSPEAAFGEIGALQAASSGTMEEVTRKLAPAAESMEVHGGSFADNASLAAAFASEKGMKEGLSALTSLGESLHKFGPTAKIAGGTVERLDALAADPKLLQKFLRSKQAPTDTKTLAVLDEYAHGGLGEHVKNIRQSLPGEEEAEKITGDTIARIHSTPAQAIADEARAHKHRERASVLDVNAAAGGLARDETESIINNKQFGFLDRWQMRGMNWLGEHMGMDPEQIHDRVRETATYNLRARALAQGDREAGEAANEIDRSSAAHKAGIVRVEATKPDPNSGKMVELMREQNQLLQRQNATLERQGAPNRRPVVTTPE